MVYCPKCNAFNDDNADRCAQCDHVLQRLQEIPESEEVQPGDAPPARRARTSGERSTRRGHAPRESIPTYLVPAILCTCFCCMPLGIVAIVYAAQVSGKLAATDNSGAQKYSANARLWCWLSFGLGLIANVLVFIVWGAVDPGEFPYE